MICTAAMAHTALSSMQLNRWQQTLMFYIVLYMAGVNLTAFLLYGCDKLAAIRHRWRVPEKTLLLCAAAGGSVGALLAMLLFRHKIRKPKFYLGVPALLLLQMALIGLIVLKTV